MLTTNVFELTNYVNVILIEKYKKSVSELKQRALSNVNNRLPIRRVARFLLIVYTQKIQQK